MNEEKECQHRRRKRPNQKIKSIQYLQKISGVSSRFGSFSKNNLSTIRISTRRSLRSTNPTSNDPLLIFISIPR
jgi:hypothetical protein